MKSPSPIRRHQSMVSLSRDHHFGLLLVWKIRQGLKKDVAAERISQYVLYFFDEDLKLHFKEEEEELFAYLPTTDTLRLQAEKEHQQIYELIHRLDQSPNNSTLLTQFADTLEAHIRFEERTLFNHLQQTLSEAQLKSLEAHTERDRNLDERWTDHFWETKKEKA